LEQPEHLGLQRALQAFTASEKGEIS